MCVGCYENGLEVGGTINWENIKITIRGMAGLE